ncbi:MAG: thiolase family protein [Dehalococcoidia bacterium]
MEEVVLAGAVRTAIGRFQGSLSEMPASDMAAAVIREAVARSGVEPADVGQVIMGICGQIGDDTYLSRHATIKAGLPTDVPAVNINRLCGSGLEAINTAARYIETGDADVVVAGGTENMTRLPYLLQKARSGYRMGDGVVEDSMVKILSDPFSRSHMGVTAETLADKYCVTREAQDELAVESQRRALAAIREGRFRDQILPLEVRVGRETKTFDTDEHPRASTVEALSAMRPAFKKDGMVTAGNASGINDGAAAVVLMSRARAEQLGVAPQLRLVGRAEAGVDPATMGEGPIPAVRKVLDRTGLSVADLDVIELNEAFASVACACAAELALPADKTNPNGGAIALGHPVGATGAILTVKLAYELERIDGRFGLVSLCIGGGQGIATVFERV